MSFDPPKSRNEAILQNMLGANNVLPPPKGRIEELLLQILQQGGSGSGVTPEQLAAAIAAYFEQNPIPEELPSGGSIGDFLRKTASGTAWQTVPFQIPRVVMTASDTTPTLDPNKLYVFPEMANLMPTFATPTDNTIANEYHFCFDSGSTATVLTIPATILQPDGLTIEANTHYEISILEGAMTAQGWAVSSS